MSLLLDSPVIETCYSRCRNTANASGRRHTILICIAAITVTTMTLNVIAPLSSLLSYVSAEPYSNSYLIWTKIEYLPSSVMIIVGDFLISWRAWIMWPGSRYIKAILIVLMMANISVYLFLQTLLLDCSAT